MVMFTTQILAVIYNSFSVEAKKKFKKLFLHKRYHSLSTVDQLILHHVIHYNYVFVAKYQGVHICTNYTIPYCHKNKFVHESWCSTMFSERLFIVRMMF